MNSKRYPPCTSTQLSNWSQIGILWQIFAFVKSAVGEMLKPFSNMWLGVLGQEWKVTYSSTNVCGVEGSYVDISCTYSYPSQYGLRETYWFIKWVTGNERDDLSLDSKYQGRVEYLGDKLDNCTVQIKDLKESDTAEKYTFRFITNYPEEQLSGTEVTLSLTSK